MDNIPQYERIGIIGDIHLPYHCPRSLALAVDVIEDLGCNLILNGDVLDMHNVSRHGKKSLELQTSLENEIEAGIEFFDMIRKRFVLKNKEVLYKRGNHEEWWDMFIAEKCPAFWNLLRLEKQFDLEGISVTPYNEPTKLRDTNLHIYHSPPSYGVNGARGSLLRKFDISALYGCTHRIQHACQTGSTGTVYNSYFNGWLGSTDLTEDHRLVFKYSKGHSNWQKGFAIVSIVNGKEYHVEIIQIKSDFSCIAQGIHYQG